MINLIISMLRSKVRGSKIYSLSLQKLEIMMSLISILIDNNLTVKDRAKFLFSE